MGLRLRSNSNGIDVLSAGEASDWAERQPQLLANAQAFLASFEAQARLADVLPRTHDARRLRRDYQNMRSDMSNQITQLVGQHVHVMTVTDPAARRFSLGDMADARLDADKPLKDRARRWQARVLAATWQAHAESAAAFIRSRYPGVPENIDLLYLVDAARQAADADIDLLLDRADVTGMKVEWELTIMREMMASGAPDKAFEKHLEHFLEGAHGAGPDVRSSS